MTPPPSHFCSAISEELEEENTLPSDSSATTLGASTTTGGPTNSQQEVCTPLGLFLFRILFLINESAPLNFVLCIETSLNMIQHLALIILLREVLPQHLFTLGEKALGRVRLG